MEAPGRGIPVLSKMVPVSICCGAFVSPNLDACELKGRSKTASATIILATRACILIKVSILLFIRIKLWICTVVVI